MQASTKVRKKDIFIDIKYVINEGLIKHLKTIEKKNTSNQLGKLIKKEIREPREAFITSSKSQTAEAFSEQN